MPEVTHNSFIAKFFPATLIPDNCLSDAGLERLAIRALDDEHIRCERTEQGALRMHAPAPEAIWLMIYSLQLALMIWLDQVKVSGQILVRRRFFIGDYIDDVS